MCDDPRYECDDARVTHVDPSTLDQSAAYVLFYLRDDLRPPAWTKGAAAASSAAAEAGGDSGGAAAAVSGAGSAVSSAAAGPEEEEEEESREEWEKKLDSKMIKMD